MNNESAMPEWVDNIRRWAELEERQWVPGDPLYSHPRDRNGLGVGAVRQLLETLCEYFCPCYCCRMWCTTCEVGWGSGVNGQPCWSCGERGIEAPASYLEVA